MARGRAFRAREATVFKEESSMKFAVCLIFCFLVFPVGEAACQSVTNNDFEGGTLTGWSVDSTDPVNGWSIASGISEPYGFFSATCQKLSIGGANHFIRQPVDIVMGTYRVTAWIEQNLAAGSAQFGFFTSLGDPIATVTVPNTPFMELSVEYTFDPVPAWPYIGYSWQNANGTAYFDTVNVVYVPPAGTPTPTATVTPTWTAFQPVTAVDGSWEIYR